MIPARRECPDSWTREHEGALMSQHRAYPHTMHECVDKLKIQRQFQRQQPAQMVHSSTMLKPVAMACLVVPMLLRKS